MYRANAKQIKMRVSTTSRALALLSSRSRVYIIYYAAPSYHCDNEANILCILTISVLLIKTLVSMYDHAGLFEYIYIIMNIFKVYGFNSKIVSLRNSYVAACV